MVGVQPKFLVFISFLVFPFVAVASDFETQCEASGGRFFVKDAEKQCLCVDPLGFVKRPFDPYPLVCDADGVLYYADLASVRCPPNNPSQELSQPLRRLSSILDACIQCTDPLGCQVFASKTRLGNGLEVGVLTNPSEALSPFWAQELIGADLAHSFTAAHRPRRVPIGIIDVGVEADFLAPRRLHPYALLESGGSNPKHGTAVAHLISSTKELSASPSAEFAAIVVGNDPSAKDQRYVTSPKLDAIGRVFGKNPPQLVNISMGMDDSPESFSSLDRLSRQSVVVFSSGNDYPLPIRPNLGALEKRNQVIVVGSMGPNGQESAFSQRGEGLTILAPSNFHLTSVNSMGLSNFGGTSGAAPLVTGALANVAAFMPPTFHLRAPEAKRLLEKTGFKNQDGLLVLNSYKLARVAERLKVKNWALSEGRRLELLEDPSLYAFDDEAEHDVSEAKRLLKLGSCEERKKAVVLLRQAFLLRPTDEAAGLLAGIYREHDLHGNARVYQSLSHSLAPAVLDLARISKDRSQLPFVRNQVDRLIEDLKLTPYHPNREQKILELNQLAQSGPSEVGPIVRQLLDALNASLLPFATLETLPPDQLARQLRVQLHTLVPLMATQYDVVSHDVGRLFKKLQGTAFEEEMKQDLLEMAANRRGANGQEKHLGALRFLSQFYPNDPKVVEAFTWGLNTASMAHALVLSAEHMREPHPEFIPPVSRFLTHVDPSYRAASIQLFRVHGISSPEAMSHLAASFELEPSADLRLRIVEIFSSTRVALPAVLSSLERALQREKDPLCMKAISDAIVKIKGLRAG